MHCATEVDLHAKLADARCMELPVSYCTVPGQVQQDFIQSHPGLLGIPLSLHICALDQCIFCRTHPVGWRVWLLRGGALCLHPHHFSGMLLGRGEHLHALRNACTAASETAAACLTFEVRL